MDKYCDLYCLLCKKNVAGISLFVRMAPVNVSDDVFLININYCKLATRIWSWSLWLTDKHTECWKWNGERERESLMCDYLSVEIGLFFLVSFNNLLNLAPFMLLWKLFIRCLKFMHLFKSISIFFILFYSTYMYVPFH